jgi:hypothetical protein
VSSDSDTTQGDGTNDAAEWALLKLETWLWVVAAPPFAILVIIRHWDPTFRSGDAFLYLSGLITAVLGENVLQLKEEGFFGSDRQSWKQLDKDQLTYYFSAIGFFVASMYFAISQPHVRHPSTSWVQILVFFFAIFSLAYTRYLYTKTVSIGAFLTRDRRNLRRGSSSIVNDPRAEDDRSQASSETSDDGGGK